MTTYLKLIVVFYLPLLFLATACSQENPSPTRAYAQLNMDQVLTGGPTSVRLSAEIASLGAEPILDHGFVWGKTRPFVELQTSQTISLGSKTGAGPFQAVIEYSFEESTRYYVRPFVKTENTIIYGNMVSFVITH